MTAFAELGQPERGREIARLIAVIAKNNNVAPVLVDRNAFLDDYGRLNDSPSFSSLRDLEDTFIVLLHSRRPDLSSIRDRSPAVAFCRLDPLKLEDTELLLQQTFRMANVAATNAQIKALALYMGGYPPTVELASTYAKFYGLEMLMADKSILTDFQVRTFGPILDRLQLDQREWEILCMLAGEPALPIEVLGEVLGISAEECVSALRHLIDLNVVLPIEYQFAISPPVRGP